MAASIFPHTNVYTTLLLSKEVEKKRETYIHREESSCLGNASTDCWILGESKLTFINKQLKCDDWNVAVYSFQTGLTLNFVLFVWMQISFSWVLSVCWLSVIWSGGGSCRRHNHWYRSSVRVSSIRYNQYVCIVTSDSNMQELMVHKTLPVYLTGWNVL